MKKGIWLLFPVLMACNQIDDIPFVDTDSPVLSAARSLDLDSDGFLDTVQIIFNEKIRDETVTASDFTLSLIGGIDFRFDTNGDKSHDEIIHLTFVDGVLGLDATQTLTYTLGTRCGSGPPPCLEDLSGNLLLTSAITVQPGAL